jgi:hypothetical protein
LFGSKVRNRHPLGDVSAAFAIDQFPIGERLS